MSGRQAAQTERDEDGGGGEIEDDAAIEARARLQGWKPRSEYHGPEGQWRDAKEFVTRVDEEMPLLRERFRRMEAQFTTTLAHQAQGQAAMAEMTDRLRKADERAYKRARRDLEAQRVAAVEAGDTSEFGRVDKELQELDAAERPAVQAQPAARAGATGQETPAQIPREVQDWGERNPWFRQDQALQQVATNMHVRLLQDEPGLTLGQNLARVSAAMHQMYPSRVGAPASGTRREPAANTQEDGDLENDNPRRRAAADVSGSGERPARRRGSGPNFDGMPADAKAAYSRYARMIGEKEIGKTKPLTKEEYARDYWAQFEE